MIGVTRSLPLFDGLKKTDYALAYCGLCKAIGRAYSQRSRLALNRDIVFLLECLTDADEKEAYRAHPKLTSLNCFSAPRAEEFDTAYRYCAAVNVLAASYLVEDKIRDEGKLGAKVARRALRGDVAAAREDLMKMGFPLWECDAALRELQTLEENPDGRQDPEEAISSRSVPVERLYGIVFGHGAVVAGKDAAAFEALGRNIGRSTYLIDAVEDLEEDQEHGHPNPLLVSGIPTQNAGTARAMISQAAGDSEEIIARIQPDGVRAGKLASLLPRAACRSCTARPGRFAAAVAKTDEWYRRRCGAVCRPWPAAIAVRVALVLLLPFVFAGNAFGATVGASSDPCANACCSDCQSGNCCDGECCGLCKGCCNCCVGCSGDCDRCFKKCLMVTVVAAIALTAYILPGFLACKKTPSRKILTALNHRWRCRKCGDWHQGLTISYAAEFPDRYFQIRRRQGNCRFVRGGNILTIEGNYFYVKGRIEIPITDGEGTFSWDIWVSCTEDEQLRCAAAKDADAGVEAEPFTGLVSNDLANYPPMGKLVASVHPHGGGVLPKIILHPAAHPLCDDQKNGITLERIEEIASVMLHPETEVQA